MQHLQQKLATLLGEGLKIRRNFINNGKRETPALANRVNSFDARGKTIFNQKNNGQNIANRLQQFHPNTARNSMNE